MPTTKKLTYFLTIALLLILAGQAAIVPATADYNVTVSNGGVTVHIHGDLLQAVNNPPLVNGSTAFGSIPVFRFRLEGGNSSAFSGALNNALREKSPAVSIDQVTLDTNSNGTNLHYDLSLKVLDDLNGRGDANTVNLGWRSFVIAGDLTVGNTSFNTIVPKYLESGISRYVQLSPSQQLPIKEVRRWWWNGQNVNREQVQPLIQNALLFNFTSLSAPLQTWNISPDFGSRILRYQSTTGFNLTFTNQITEVGEVGTLYTNAIYRMKATVEAPWGTTASGDTLVLESQVPWGVWLMLTLIIVSAGFLVGTIILERRFLRAPGSIKIRKSKR